ncbi:Gfo/Idh/MocA family oxidoreductase [Pseudoxanthomonas sp. CF125]|uniref:Gfo/Idh/MocA family protein n=1 Tax=Pseudoxanthomonas sp. CF125 TaxID=1855303 RepID=UPI00088FA16A|nr:Gfo/Idh/MocA family oxidoreductase [Pseudoxanthomonas sp. CF125]SDR04426.1 Predicted dehydrogenase [Pseudoxanthomonas sp. CF125]
MTGRKLRFGMIGGGRGAFIGAVHRIAAQMDGQAELVAGAFSSDPQRSRDSAADLFVAADRAYGSYREMAVAEAARPPGERLDFVVIVTPNDQHFPAATLFLEHGFNVVCDKPVTLTLAEARALRETVARSGKVFALTHNYTGNAMVKQARALVRGGALGTLRKVVVEYSQGWLASDIESGGHKQASWRTDPARSGAAGCMGDIGTHAENLARYVTGLRIAELCADLTTFVPGRRLDDDGNLLLRFEGGARGVLHSSQIAVGEENKLSLRVYGSEASLEWQQEHPNELIVKYPDRPREILRRGNGYVGEDAQRVTRIPAGHPEGYLEAFANLYREAFRAIAAEVAGEPPPDDLDLPGIDDGVAGMAFIEAAVASARIGAVWVPIAS